MRHDRSIASEEAASAEAPSQKQSRSAHARGWLGNPLVVTCVSAVLVYLIIPQVTRKWQDHAQVLDIQLRLAQLRTWRVQVEAPVFAVIGSFVWIPLLLIEIHWEIGVDVWARWPVFVGWLVFCGWISLALVLAVVGLARWTGRMRWITDNAAGKAVREAEAALEEIARFEREA